MIGYVAATVAFIEFKPQALESLRAGKNVVAMRISPKSNYAWMLEQKEHVIDTACMAKFDEISL